MVAMNAETFVEDVESVKPGGYLFYDNTKPLDRSLRREDINEIGIPIASLMLPEFSDPSSGACLRTSPTWELLLDC